VLVRRSHLTGIAGPSGKELSAALYASAGDLQDKAVLSQIGAGKRLDRLRALAHLRAIVARDCI